VSTVFLADTSAFTVAVRSPQAETRLRQLAIDGVLATFVTVDLEMGYSARNPREHQGIARIRARLIQFPCVDGIALRAREVQALMALHGQHRTAGVMDLLTAAAAEYYGATLVHYDADFDHLAAVTAQPVEWITPQGSVP
jgi:predicted nucleic acid-binding protein